MVAAAMYPDPQKLYDPDPLIKPSLMSDYAAPCAGVITGFAGHCGVNWIRNRHVLSSLHMYPIGMVFFGTTFYAVNQLLRRYYSRRDTIHKHYVTLHPEEFPPPPKVKIGDLLEDWKPVR